MRFFFLLSFLSLAFPSLAVVQNVVIINEVAWMGTSVSANDEWIELFNPTQESIDLSGWKVAAEDGSPTISLSGIIPAQGYAVLERTNDESVPEVPALVIYSGALENQGEKLMLLDVHGTIVDEVDGSKGWIAGDSKTRQTMERSALSGAEGWHASSNPGGTPGKQNGEPLSQQKIPSGGYAGYMVGIPFFPQHFAIALLLAALCCLAILALKRRLTDSQVSSSSDAPED